MMLALAMLLAGQSVPADDPLAPAANGAMQCYTPNVAAKTCKSMASYTRNPDGSFHNVATLLVTPDRAITLETAVTVMVRDGAVCGMIKREDVTAGTLRVDGQLLPADQATPFLAQIAAAFESMSLLGSEICTRYAPDGDGFKAESTINGAVRPEATQHMIWVMPTNGFKVAP